MKKFMKPVTCILVLAFLLSLTIPTLAATSLSISAPSAPSGFYYSYSVARSKTFDMTFSGIVLTLMGLIPGMGYVSAAIGIAQSLGQNLDGGSLPTTYVDYVYAAEDPEINYGVPYVYWHRLKYTFNIPGGGTYTRWSSYYEYAVAPR